MSNQRLRASPRHTEADWLHGSLAPFGTGVASVVPSAFAAYARIDHREPDEPGNLPASLLASLCTALAGHTSTPESCWFCLWEGYGWLRHAAPLVGGNEPSLHLPHRSYLLFEGPLEAAAEFGWNLTEDCFIPAAPTLFWPHDRAWCVACDIDLPFTLVGGPEPLIESLTRDSNLRALRVAATDSW
jgi:hypothetical protein